MSLTNETLTSTPLKDFRISDILIFSESPTNEEIKEESIKNEDTGKEPSIKNDQDNVPKKELNQDDPFKKAKAIGAAEYAKKNSEKILGKDEIKLSKEQFEQFQKLVELQNKEDEKKSSSFDDETKKIIEKIKVENQSTINKLKTEIENLKNHGLKLEQNNISQMLDSKLINKAVSLGAHEPEAIVELIKKELKIEKDDSGKNQFRVLDKQGETRVNQTGDYMTPEELMERWALEDDSNKKYLFKPNVRSGLGLNGLFNIDNLTNPASVNSEQISKMNENDFIKLAQQSGMMKQFKTS